MDETEDRAVDRDFLFDRRDQKADEFAFSFGD